MIDLPTFLVFFAAAAALGVSAILATSATAFATVKWAGAAYLIYLGVRTLLGRDRLDPGRERAPAGGGALGTVTTLLTSGVDLIVAFGAGPLSALLSRDRGVRRVQRYGTGTVLVGLGAYVAADEAR